MLKIQVIFNPSISRICFFSIDVFLDYFEWISKDPKNILILDAIYLEILLRYSNKLTSSREQKRDVPLRSSSRLDNPC